MHRKFKFKFHNRQTKKITNIGIVGIFAHRTRDLSVLFISNFILSDSFMCKEKLAITISLMVRCMKCSSKHHIKQHTKWNNFEVIAFDPKNRHEYIYLRREIVSLRIYWPRKTCFCAKNAIQTLRKSLKMHSHKFKKFGMLRFSAEVYREIIFLDFFQVFECNANIWLEIKRLNNVCNQV